MKKSGILNKDISEVVAGMGHTDLLIVSDVGLPIPAETRRIDLAVSKGVPGFIATVEAISQELYVEKIIIAKETLEVSPEIYKALIKVFPNAAVETVSHGQLKQLCQKAVAVVRTGECTSYANVGLVSGVEFP